MIAVTDWSADVAVLPLVNLPNKSSAWDLQRDLADEGVIPPRALSWPGINWPELLYNPFTAEKKTIEVSCVNIEKK